VNRAGAVILAAGASRRMGANKLVAMLGGKPVLGWVLEAVAAAGLPPPVVVTDGRSEAVGAVLKSCPHSPAIAPDAAQGMARSIAAGIAAVPHDWQAALICLGDMPLVSSDLLRALAARSHPDAICAPVYAGRRGHPVLWGRNHFAALMALEGDNGARGLMAGFEAVAWHDDSIFGDVDTPEDLARAEERIATR
jgi:molybdenum cofactor cytidylyltransferase